MPTDRPDTLTHDEHSDVLARLSQPASRPDNGALRSVQDILRPARQHPITITCCVDAQPVVNEAVETQRNDQ